MPIKQQMERYKDFIDLILAYQESFITILAPHLSEEVIIEFTNSFTEKQNNTMGWINDNIVKPKELEQSIISFIANVQKASISDISREMKVHYATAKNHLERLSKEGKLLSKTFEGDSQTYYVPLEVS